MQCCTGVCGSTRNLTDLNVPVTRRCGAGEQHVERERIRVGVHVQVNVLAVVGATDARNVVGWTADGEDVSEALGGRVSARVGARSGDLELVKVQSNLTNVGTALFDVQRALAGCCVAAVVARILPVRVVQNGRRAAWFQNDCNFRWFFEKNYFVDWTFERLQLGLLPGGLSDPLFFSFWPGYFFLMPDTT